MFGKRYVVAVLGVTLAKVHNPWVCYGFGNVYIFKLILIAQHWHIMFCGNNTAPKYALPSASFASKTLHVEVVGSNSSIESKRGG